MRVDLVTPRFYPSVGGIEESVSQLGTGLLRRGHDVTVHTMRLHDWPEEERLQGIEIRRYEATMNRGYYVSRFEPELLGDVVHLNAYGHQTNDYVIERLRGRIPLFLSTHHGARFPKPDLAAKTYHAFYNRFRGIPNLDKLAGLLVPTGYDATYFADRGVKSERIHVVPSGADERLFQDVEPWTPPGVAPGFVMYLGRLHKEKGILDLLEAHALLPDPPRLVLAGRDEGLLSTLDQDVVSAQHVVVLTDLTEAQRFGLLASCRLLVLPSHYEGQGIVLAEAWAQRKPVVATSAGAVPSVVDDGHDGILVPVKDPEKLAAAIRRVSADDALASRLGAAGREKAEKQYRWPGIVEKVEGLYKAALDARRA